MPTGRKKTTQKNEPAELRELKAIHTQLQHIRNDIDGKLHKSFWRRTVFSFVTGIVKGLGFTIGATIIAAIAIFLLHWITGWVGLSDAIDIWIQEQLNSTPI